MHKLLPLSFLFLITCLSFKLYAQDSKNSLTILSEDNALFLLYINGVLYNEQAAMAIRIEEVPLANLHVKVTYVQNHIPSIENNNLALSDRDGNKQDITYAIHTNRRGANAFLVYQVIPLNPINVNSNKASLYKYGHANRALTWPRNIDTRKYEPYEYRKTQQGNFNEFNNRSKSIISHSELTDLIKAIGKERFENDKLAIAKQGLDGRLILTEDVIKIMKKFAHDESKLAFAKYAYIICSDPNNYYKVNSSLSFSASKESLQQYIAQQKNK